VQDGAAIRSFEVRESPSLRQRIRDSFASPRVHGVWDGSTWTNDQDGVAADSGSFSTPIVTGDQPLTLAINSGYDNTAFEGVLYDGQLGSSSSSDSRDPTWSELGPGCF